MEDVLIMSKKSLERKSLLEGYKYGKLTLKEIGLKLNLSYRQVKRIWKRYKVDNDLGLIHRGRNRTPSNAYNSAFKDKVIRLYRKKYLDFGPTFACEKLSVDDGIRVHPETLRLWLKSEGLWSLKRKRKTHRERRERRSNFGDLLQIDGSIHDWFGENEKHCLLNIVDDATGVSFALLDKGETTEILLRTFKRWVEMYGIPKSVYVDLKSVYVSPKRMKEKYDDDLLIKEGFSVFEEVCKRLNIEIIKAYSAQAKGRVERKHRVFQDRFVKDLKLYGIKTCEEANNYLEEKFLNYINNKFAQAPEKSDSHRSPKLYGDLDQIFCWKYRRKVKNDWSIQFKREYYQIKKNNLVNPQQIITIKKHLDGTMRFWFEESELSYSKLKTKPEPPSRSKVYYESKGGVDVIERSKLSRINKTKSPWSQFNPKWLKNKSIKKKELEAVKSDLR